MKQARATGAMAILAALGCAASVTAQVTISVDMDPGTVGIQDTLVATAGQTFTADLWITVDPAGVSSYSISTQFDTAELALNGSPAASVPALPGGLGSFGTPSENNALGRVYSFAAGTLGLGPAGTSFVFGSIKFQVTTPSSDGLADITPGLFNLGVDGFFDNAGNPVVPTFLAGFVAVPEPAGTAIFMSAVAALSLACRKWRA